MNTPCPERREAIDLHAAGWLAPAEERDLLAHLEACPACRAEHARAVALAGALTHAYAGEREIRAAPAPLPLPSRTSPSPSRLLPWLALAAAVALVFALPRRPAPVAPPTTAWTPPPPPTQLAYLRAAGESDQALFDLLDLHARTLNLREEPLTLAALLE